MPDPAPISETELHDWMARHQAERFALPALTLAEWATLRGIRPSTARFWAAGGHIPAYLSGSTWLIVPGTQPPSLAPGRPNKA